MVCASAICICANTGDTGGPTGTAPSFAAALGVGPDVPLAAPRFPPAAPRFPPAAPLAAPPGNLPASPAAPLAAPYAPIDRFADECATENPFFVTTRLNRPEVRAAGLIGLDEAPALIAFRYTESIREHYVLAKHGDIGSAYGLAVSAAEPAVYVGAYLKRGSPYVAGGPGAIYRVDLVSDEVRLWAVVPGVGSDPHDVPVPWPDNRARDLVGLRGLGDLDITPDGSSLFAMNLADHRIYRYEVPSGLLESTIPTADAAEGWAAEGRPFGLYTDGAWLYHGIVRTSDLDAASPGPFEAYVYRSRLGGGDMRRIATIVLDADRGRLVRSVPARWNRWRDGTATIDPEGLDAIYPQPILSDIELSDTGDLVIGFRDRFADMTFNDPGRVLPSSLGPGVPPLELEGLSAGDVMLSPGLGDRIEPLPEHFEGDSGPGSSDKFDEIVLGGLARVLVRDRTVASAAQVLVPDGGGALWLENDTGETLWRESIHTLASPFTFGRTGGLGDVERLCWHRPPPTPNLLPSPSTSPSPTSTGTSTSTPTLTSTASPSPTQTPTALPPTPTESPSPTPISTQTPHPTATRAPSPTWTASPSATPTGTPSLTPTLPPPTPVPSKTARPGPIYVPIVQRPQTCGDVHRAVDVALVLDRSTSMARPIVDGGRTKDDASIDAARSFVAELALRPGGRGPFDRVAIVGFNDTAWVEQPLGERRSLAQLGLESIALLSAHGTRLDLAFEAGLSSLEPALEAEDETPVRHRVLVLLTDGLPNRVPTPAPNGRQEDTVLARAAEARDAGVTIYTIGLGADGDVSDDLLSAAAGSPDRYYRAPNGEDLAAIYLEIAARVRVCR